MRDPGQLGTVAASMVNCTSNTPGADVASGAVAEPAARAARGRSSVTPAREAAPAKPARRKLRRVKVSSFGCPLSERPGRPRRCPARDTRPVYLEQVDRRGGDARTALYRGGRFEFFAEVETAGIEPASAVA
jgi:hypothetical protein